MQKIVLIFILGISTLLSNFNFGECSGSGTFEQQIVQYSNDYENTTIVGQIPQGIEGLRIELISDKDVDIRLYGENEDKIVHWPYGLLNGSTQATKPYKDVPVTYSGYNGVGGEKGHEFIEVNGITPTTMTMKAFGYKAGYATVNYSWTGKVGCTSNESGTGSFTQALVKDTTSLVGSIPPNVESVQINLNSDKDLDIQLYGADGTAIASWKPMGLMAGATKQSINYHDMNITWSGYNGTDGQKGYEYITVTPKTTEVLVMKVFGYEAGAADVTYSWGDVLSDTIPPVITLNGDASLTLYQDENYEELGATASDNVDGDITANIETTSNVDTSTLGTYKVKYNISDTSGNNAVEVVRTVYVIKDTVKPVITLLGNSNVTINKGEEYSDSGATASDNVDGDITSSIEINVTVDINVAGTYTVKYMVHDNAGNLADEVVRTVTVVVPLEGEELIYGGENENGALDKSKWSYFGDTYKNTDRSYNGKLFIYSAPKDTGSGMYQEIPTEIGREYEVSAILIGTDTNRKEEFNGESYFTIGSKFPVQNKASVFAESNHVTGGVETKVRFRFNAVSTTTYLALRSDKAWHYASARAISVKAVNLDPIADITKPVITLIGQKEITLKQDENYEELGATALDNQDGNLTNNIEITSNVNTSIAGTYTVKYNVNDEAGNAADEVVRTITVKEVVDNIRPVLSMLGEYTVVVAQDQKGGYSDAGATAYDNKDGNITANIETLSTVDITKPGRYTVKYNVVDNAGNSAYELTREIRVLSKGNSKPDESDREKPVIQLNGEHTIELALNDSYSDARANASDNKDGDLTSNIVITSNVDTSKVGVYQVKYNVSDAAGNEAYEVIRDVIVKSEGDTIAPTITLLGNLVKNVIIDTEYSDAGATANDNRDGDITENIEIISTVDTSVLGTYEVKYNVSDAHGNKAVEVVRTIKVLSTLDVKLDANATYHTNDTITVEIDNISEVENSKLWVGIYEVGEASTLEHMIYYQYVDQANNSKINLTKVKAQSKDAFKRYKNILDDTEYELRVVAYVDGKYVTYATKEITMKPPVYKNKIHEVFNKHYDYQKNALNKLKKDSKGRIPLAPLYYLQFYMQSAIIYADENYDLVMTNKLLELVKIPFQEKLMTNGKWVGNNDMYQPLCRKQYFSLMTRVLSVAQKQGIDVALSQREIDVITAYLDDWTKSPLKTNVVADEELFVVQAAIQFYDYASRADVKILQASLKNWKKRVQDYMRDTFKARLEKVPCTSKLSEHNCIAVDIATYWPEKRGEFSHSGYGRETSKDDMYGADGKVQLPENRLKKVAQDISHARRYNWFFESVKRYGVSFDIDLIVKPIGSSTTMQADDILQGWANNLAYRVCIGTAENPEFTIYSDGTDNWYRATKGSKGSFQPGGEKIKLFFSTASYGMFGVYNTKIRTWIKKWGNDYGISYSAGDNYGLQVDYYNSISGNMKNEIPK